MAKHNPIFDTLRRFDTFATLDDSQLSMLANQSELLRAHQGDTLMELGSEDSRLLFLIEGEIKLMAADGASHVVRDRDIAALGPVSRLRPSRYQVLALTAVRYLMIEQYLLDSYLDEASGPAMVVVEESYAHEPNELLEESAAHPLMFDVLDDLNHGRIVVPSEADIAIRVGRALRAVDNPGQIAEALGVCPALTLKAVRAAQADPNQFLPVQSTREAVERLGKEQTYGLAVNCILRESLRTHSTLIRNRTHVWWERSMRVAAISRVLSDCGDQFDPEYAALIGLLHSIAEPVLLSYADRHTDLDNGNALDDVVYDNRAELGRLLADSWELPQEIVEANARCNHWGYEHSGEPDYIDVMLVAQWHASIGQMHSRPLPNRDEVPAFRRLGLHVASTDFLQQLEEAGDRAIEHIDSLLEG